MNSRFAQRFEEGLKQIKEGLGKKSGIKFLYYVNFYSQIYRRVNGKVNKFLISINEYDSSINIT